ncbi:MAG TPA: hypothetical protein VMB71_12135 [Acetobacteraceae bacterium]|nr:hypothetical protein [Acetobacteraceae bacterium]
MPSHIMEKVTLGFLPWPVGLAAGATCLLLALSFLPPQAAGLATVGLALWLAVSARNVASAPDGLWAVLLFLAAQLLAVLRADDPGLAAGYASFLVPGVILYVCATRGEPASDRSWMLAWTILSFATSVSVLCGWMRVRFGAPLLPDEDAAEAAIRLSGDVLLIVPNDVCLVAILLAFPLGLLMLRPRRFVLALAGAATGLTFLALAVARSRTGFAVAATEVLVMSLARPQLLLCLPPLGLFVFIADRLFGLGVWGKLTFTDSLAFHGVAGRLGLWVAAARMFGAAPLFGQGAQSFGPGHWPYLPSWAPRFPEGHVMWSHNLFLDTLAEQGLTGFGALATMLLLALRNAARRAWRASASPGRVPALCGLATLAGFLLAAGLELSFIRRFVPVVMFGILGFVMRESSQANVAKSSVAGCAVNG